MTANINNKNNERPERPEVLTILATAFYGNRTIVTIEKDNIDIFLLGFLSKNVIDITKYRKADQTIVKIPNSNIVGIYNKYESEEDKEEGEEYLLVSIPEIDCNIYSRTIFCRMDDNGNLMDFNPMEDYDKVKDYIVKE